MRFNFGRATKVLGAAVFAVAGLACSSGGGDVPAFVPNFQASDVRVDTDVAGSAGSVAIRACSEGKNVYTVWADSRNGSTDIYFNRSTDGGVTWQVTDTRLDTSAAGSSSSDDPEIVCDGLNIYVVWEDARDGSKDIRFQRSTDGGVTWLAADVRLDADTAGAAQSGDALVGAANGKVYVVWEEERDGNRDIYFRASQDGGATFGGEISLNTNGGGVSFSDRPRMAVSGNNVYVVWHDSRSGLNDIYMNASSDGGLTFFGTDVRVDTDVAGAAASNDPAIDAAGGRVYVAWSDSRSGSGDIRANSSSDGGVTWLAADVRVDTDVAGAAASIRPIVACDDTNVFIAWVDERAGLRDIHFNRSTDAGATFGVADLRLNTDVAGTATADFVKLASDGRNIYAVWTDSRDGASDIRFTHSNDRGVTFQAADTRQDTNAAGAANSVFPRISASGGNVYVVWSDSRNGSADVYARTSPKPE